MNTSEILSFLSKLRENNTREWFSTQKEYCKTLQKNFEELVQSLINGIASFDPDMKGLDAKNCMFRLYRDTRFSPDKTPYKTHFGAYMGAKGGRNSLRADYYFHIEPGGSFVSCGVYIPESDILKALRRAIYDNIDEWLEITGKPFSDFFPEMFGGDDKLKKMPAGFPKEWAYGELLKYKSYAFGHDLSDDFFSRKEIVKPILEIYKAALPVNRFLNFTIDEVLKDRKGGM